MALLWILLLCVLYGMTGSGAIGVLLGLGNIVLTIYIMALIGDFFLLKKWDRGNWCYDRAAHRKALKLSKELDRYITLHSNNYNETRIWLEVEIKRNYLRSSSIRQLKKLKKDILSGHYEIQLNYLYCGNRWWYENVKPEMLKMAYEEANSWKIDHIILPEERQESISK